MNYNEYQNQTSSEKITLAIVEASKRLTGFALYSGSVYSLSNVSAIIRHLEESGTAYTEVDSIANIVASSYYHDRDNATLYLQTSDGSHPNGKFVSMVQALHFANVPIVLPHDLATGDDVFFEPLIQSTSAFGVEIDTVNQISEAIEGSGTLTLINDQSFWPANYDKLVFENQKCTIYSYNRQLSASEARKLFVGTIEGKSYSDAKVSLKLKDQLSVLREPVQLTTIQALEARHDESLTFARQRMILGKVYGHRPVNIDHVKDGYPITGTVSISSGATTLTGSGTTFLAELSPDDELLLDGTRYVVATVTNDTNLELTEAYADADGLTGATVYVQPDQPKRYMNRVWKIAGHALREPVAIVSRGSTTTTILVDSTDDFHAGDDIYIGTLDSGELAVVGSVINSMTLQLNTSLATVPSAGTEIRRPAVQDVRINDIKLRYYRDYTLDAESATLTLNESAEANVSPVRQMTGTISFTAGSRTATGTGTSFEKSLRPGDMIGRIGSAEYYEILSVDSDTSVTLRTSAASDASGTAPRYKPLIFDEEVHVLTCNVLGRTEDGTTTGTRLKNAPQMVKALLTDIGLAAELNEASFTEASEIAYQELGIVIPAKYNDRKEPSYRNVINDINRSVFGTLVQTSDFKYKYEVLQPNKPVGLLALDEADCLGFKADATSKNMVKSVTLNYLRKEYDYEAAEESTAIIEKVSDNAQYLLKTGRTKTFDSYLVDIKDATRQAGRWALLLENSTGTIRIDTKLQAASVEVGDIVDFTHRKLYEAYGNGAKRKLVLVESVKKTGQNIQLECTDLSNAFNRIAAITTNTDTYANSDEDEKLYGGFITDQYGLIDNDPDSFGQNIIW